jgi:hypothetical protein
MILSLLLSGFLSLVELNCENLFDCRHDSLKQDMEWTPEGQRKWTPGRYWRKLNNIGQEILSCQQQGVPDLVALVEVENDSCLFDLTRRSLLRGAGYEYLMTQSPDLRGIDVALLYQPLSFRPICYDYLRVIPLEDMRPTRDILYVQGLYASGDTLHVFVVHSPSRYGGEIETRPYRLQVVKALQQAIKAISDDGKIMVLGDFNDYADSPSLKRLYELGLQNVTANIKGRNGTPANYRYQGEWHSLDHVLVSPSLSLKVDTAYINDAPFLLEEETEYGGKRPRRSFHGFRFQQGFSDHLPLVVRFTL